MKRLDCLDLLSIQELVSKLSIGRGVTEERRLFQVTTWYAA